MFPFFKNFAKLQSLYFFAAGTCPPRASYRPLGPPPGTGSTAISSIFPVLLFTLTLTVSGAREKRFPVGGSEGQSGCAGAVYGFPVKCPVACRVTMA